MKAPAGAPAPAAAKRFTVFANGKAFVQRSGDAQLLVRAELPGCTRSSEKTDALVAPGEARASKEIVSVAVQADAGTNVKL